MKVIETAQGFREQYGRCVATIGKFDGVHIGHQSIVRQLRARAAQYGVPAVVIVIEPHPEEFFAASPRDCPARLSETEEKIALLADLGVDFVFRLHFNRELASLSAETYIESMLVDGLGIHALIAGSDFRFGHQRRGDFDLLQRYGVEHDFEVIETESCDYQGVRVSSTYVREKLAEADFELVEQLLGRPYNISGQVEEGQQLGRDLGYPTCNVALNRRSIPLHGVYACEALIERGGEQQCLRGAANIGYRPTVSDTDTALLEVHLLDFEDDIYGIRITVIFRHRIRPEVKFDSLSELKEQIVRDVAATRAWFDEAAANQRLE